MLDAHVWIFTWPNKSCLTIFIGTLETFAASTLTGLSGMHFEFIGGPEGLAFCNAGFCIAVFRSFLGHCVPAHVSPEGRLMGWLFSVFLSWGDFLSTKPELRKLLKEKQRNFTFFFLSQFLCILPKRKLWIRCSTFALLPASHT